MMILKQGRKVGKKANYVGSRCGKRDRENKTLMVGTTGEKKNV